ncbi:MAG: MbnP family protein [Ferruginibacter sp.]
MKRLIIYLIALLPAFHLLSGCQKNIEASSGTVKITFRNTVNGSPLALNSQIYSNPFNETYTVSKFRYYITNVSLNGPGGVTLKENNSYHLVDEAVPTSLSFYFETTENSFSDLVFTLGVDSARNNSGAQTDALDPLNDMFWTWNSGYVMAKMEGNSPQSTVVGNKIEYHIGGFTGANNVLKTINLSFPSGKLATIKKGQTSEIIVEADLNTWWQNPNDIKIAVNPVITSPGVLAKKVADNYSKMFTIKDVTNF